MDHCNDYCPAAKIACSQDENCSLAVAEFPDPTAYGIVHRRLVAEHILCDLGCPAGVQERLSFARGGIYTLFVLLYACLAGCTMGVVIHQC